MHTVDQIDPKCLVSEALVSRFLPRCSIAQSRIDISFLNPENPKHLFSFIELKNDLTEPAQIEQALLQTICYLVCPLAYCRWGILRLKEPLIALTVTPSCIYRLTLSKPSDAPFGLNMKIEQTTDLITMEWALSEHVGRFIQDCKKSVAQDMVRDLDVDLVDWTPFNITFGSIPREPLNREPNLGFLIKTKGEFVMNQKEAAGIRASFSCPDVELDKVIYVKYPSALLDVCHQEAVNSIRNLLVSAALATKSSTDPGSQGFPIKHPYLGMVSVNLLHPLIVMNDMGQSLQELLSEDSFRTEWRSNAAMRRAFFTDIGLSALNLIDYVGLCHNDIRPANIAVKDGSFCLIDFDMSRSCVVNQRGTAFSPEMFVSEWVNEERMLFYTVAQIAVTVFMLSADRKLTIEKVAKSSIWHTNRDRSHINASFQRWLRSKGSLVADFIEAVRDAGNPKGRTRAFKKSSTKASKQHAVNVLEQMLS